MTSTGALPSQQQMAEEASKKRELRLLKNRYEFTLDLIQFYLNFYFNNLGKQLKNVEEKRKNISSALKTVWLFLRTKTKL